MVLILKAPSKVLRITPQGRSFDLSEIKKFIKSVKYSNQKIINMSVYGVHPDPDRLLNIHARDDGAWARGIEFEDCGLISLYEDFIAFCYDCDPECIPLLNQVLIYILENYIQLEILNEDNRDITTSIKKYCLELKMPTSNLG